MREAVWGPFVGFLGQHRSLEILAFVVLYKLSDNLTQALTGPFLVQTGFDDVDVGVARRRSARRPRSSACSSAGSSPTASASAARSGSSASSRSSRTSATPWSRRSASTARVMYAAQAFEHVSSGLGTGAFGVLLLRLTQKRFSATQYALLSSLFTLPRVLAGPVAGVLADAMGWRDFFVLTVVFGDPGHGDARPLRPVGRARRRVRRAGARPGAVRSRAPASPGARPSVPPSPCCVGLAGLALAAGLSGLRAGRGFTAGPALASVVRPRNAGEWTTTAGLVVLAVLGGLATAATLVAARRGSPGPGPRNSAAAREYHCGEGNGAERFGVQVPRARQGGHRGHG